MSEPQPKSITRRDALVKMGQGLGLAGSAVVVAKAGEVFGKQEGSMDIKAQIFDSTLSVPSADKVPVSKVLSSDVVNILGIDGVEEATKTGNSVVKLGWKDARLVIDQEKVVSYDGKGLVFDGTKFLPNGSYEPYSATLSPDGAMLKLQAEVKTKSPSDLESDGYSRVPNKLAKQANKPDRQFTTLVIRRPASASEEVTYLEFSPDDIVLFTAENEVVVFTGIGQDLDHIGQIRDLAPGEEEGFAVKYGDGGVKEGEVQMWVSNGKDLRQRHRQRIPELAISEAAGEKKLIEQIRTAEKIGREVGPVYASAHFGRSFINDGPEAAVIGSDGKHIIALQAQEKRYFFGRKDSVDFSSVIVLNLDGMPNDFQRVTAFDFPDVTQARKVSIELMGAHDDYILISEKDWDDDWKGTYSKVGVFDPANGKLTFIETPENVEKLVQTENGLETTIRDSSDSYTLPAGDIRDIRNGVISTEASKGRWVRKTS